MSMTHLKGILSKRSKISTGHKGHNVTFGRSMIMVLLQGHRQVTSRRLALEQTDPSFELSERNIIKCAQRMGSFGNCASKSKIHSPCPCHLFDENKIAILEQTHSAWTNQFWSDCMNWSMLNIWGLDKVISYPATPASHQELLSQMGCLRFSWPCFLKKNAETHWILRNAKRTANTEPVSSCSGQCLWQEEREQFHIGSWYLRNRQNGLLVLLSCLCETGCALHSFFVSRVSCAVPMAFEAFIRKGPALSTWQTDHLKAWQLQLRFCKEALMA